MKVKALVIDPFREEIYETLVGQDNIQEYQKIVGGYIEAAGRYDNLDVLFVNEEGLFKDNQKFFSLKELTSQPLAGVGFMVGHDEEGCSQDVKITQLDLAMKVEWVQPV